MPRTNLSPSKKHKIRKSPSQEKKIENFIRIFSPKNARSKIRNTPEENIQKNLPPSKKNKNSKIPPQKKKSKIGTNNLTLPKIAHRMYLLVRVSFGRGRIVSDFFYLPGELSDFFPVRGMEIPIGILWGGL